MKSKEEELKNEIKRRENLPKKSKEAFETTIFYNDLKLKELKAELKGYQKAKKDFEEMIDIPKLRKDFELRLERGCIDIEAFVFVLEELKQKLKGAEK